mmetsp:Transcript_14517/g.42870  ORF Transcript_14517/g.42870 Transcript_14517/m.42870 type:complete len:296 (-) Transcript_14517:14-901(-)
MLQVVQVAKPLEVRLVMSLEVHFELLILVHERRTDGLQPPKRLLLSLEFTLLALDLFIKILLVDLQGLAFLLHVLNVLFHGAHKLLDALLNVFVLGGAVQIPRDGVQKLESLCTLVSHLTLLAEQVKESGATLRDLCGQGARPLDVLQLGRHGGGLLPVSLLLLCLDPRCAVQFLGDLQKLLDRPSVSSIQPLRVQLDLRLGGHGLGRRAQEFHPVVLRVDLLRDMDGRVIPLDHPIEHVCNKLEVRCAEVLHRDQPRVPQRPHDLREVAQLPETHGFQEWMPPGPGLVLGELLV